MTGVVTIGPKWGDGLAPHVAGDALDPRGRVRAAFSLRVGGVSAAPFDSLNLGGHVGDAPEAVAENRRRLRGSLALQSDPVWLQQVHGTSVAVIGGDAARAPLAVVAGAAAPDTPVADASVTRHAHVACAILVADCIPVLFASHDGAVVGAAHAGWRGLAGGVLENTVSEMIRLGAAPAKLSAWLGPGIGPMHFEVGGEVRDAFLAGDAGASDAFVPKERAREAGGARQEKWLCDLPAIARRRLTRVGVNDISGGEICTYADRDRFYSHRRDGRCGRMAALIWRE